MPHFPLKFPSTLMNTHFGIHYHIVFSGNFQCFSMLSCDNNQGDEQRLCKFVVIYT